MFAGGYLPTCTQDGENQDTSATCSRSLFMATPQPLPASCGMRSLAAVLLVDVPLPQCLQECQVQPAPYCAAHMLNGIYTLGAAGRGFEKIAEADGSEVNPVGEYGGDETDMQNIAGRGRRPSVRPLDTVNIRYPLLLTTRFYTVTYIQDACRPGQTRASTHRRAGLCRGLPPAPHTHAPRTSHRPRHTNHHSRHTRPRSIPHL